MENPERAKADRAKPGATKPDKGNPRVPSHMLRLQVMMRAHL